MKFIRKLIFRLILLLAVVFAVGYFAFDFDHNDWYTLYTGEPVKTENEIELENDEVFQQIMAIENVFAEIDDYARDCPESAKSSFSELADYLEAGAEGDKEKARAIYVWLTDNISYNDTGYNSGDYGDVSAEGVLKSGLAVCSGFGNLYTALGKEMDLEIIDVSGFAKGYSFSKGIIETESNHAWNMIKIDGEWRVYDATWGRGHSSTVDGKMVSKNEFTEKWFDVDPYAAIFTHYPENSKDSKIPNVFSLKDYYNIKFDGMAIFELGFDPKEMYDICVKNNNHDAPTCWVQDYYIDIRKAPNQLVLKKGEDYDFVFYIPEIEELAFSVGSEWDKVKSNNGIFKHTYSPENKGELLIHYTSPVKGDKDKQDVFMKYEVK
ncbi:MAG: hypothetical protein ACI857_000405 [Arenicella sp.]|jgi:hypothetical protein